MSDRQWIDAHRPEAVESYVFQNEEHKEFINSLLAKGDFPNLLLSGIQGTGKTTLAKMLIQQFDVNAFDVKIINASIENGIDVIREDIQKFCMPMPIGKYKVILFEEADRLSKAAQDALRALIEDFSDTVRFIFTCNYPHKIIPALHSRFQSLNFEAFERDDVYEMLLGILTEENVEVPDIESIEAHVELYYPDMRKMIQSIQQSSHSGTLGAPMGLSSGDEVLDKWTEIWTNNPTLDALMDLMPLVDNNNAESLYRVMYENISNLNDDLVIKSIPIVAEHLYRYSFVADQEINMAACLISIFVDF